MRVTLVWNGAYSDKEVVAIFSSREKAQEFIDISNKYSNNSWDEYWTDGDEYDIDSAKPSTPDYLRVTIRNKDGKTKTDWERGNEKQEDYFSNKGNVAGESNVFSTTVHTNDVEKAVKVASERRAMYMNELIMRGEL